MIIQFFKTVANLKQIPRKGWQTQLKLENPESVADHCYSMTTLAMVLSDIQNIDTLKVLKMSLLHDLAESVTGDYTPNEITRKQKEKIENQTINKIIKNLPNNLANEYLKIWKDFQENKSLEASFVHEVDKLEMALQAKMYENQGISKNKLESFFNSAKKDIKNKQLQEILTKLLQD